MRMERFDLRQMALMTVGVFVAIFLVGSFGPYGSAERGQLDKRQLALWGGLELERAVQALKDAILRGDPAYGADFDRHMQQVERATTLYRSRGPLGREEQDALARLQAEVPRYRSAIATVQHMQEEHAPIPDIDRAVKGEDRPVSAALEELESAAAAQSRAASGSPLTGGGSVVATALLCAVLSGCLVALGQFAFGRVRTWDDSWRELALKVVRWEEEKQARASHRLHDGVCQSVAAVMYLLRGAEGWASDRSSGALRARIDDALRDAVRDARAVAMDLCPPPVHDVGLLGSLESIWADARSRAPDLRLTTHSDVPEKDIPAGLKRELERLAPMAVQWTNDVPGARQLVWSLTRERGQLRLGIGVQTDASGTVDAPATGPRRPRPGPAEALAARIRLSGGRTRGIEEVPGGKALVARWRLG